MRKVTAVLLEWKRPTELKEIERHLSTFDFIDDIIVWNNSRGENLIMYGRYAAARGAKNQTIYVQDDDCIIQNLQALYDAYDGSKLVNGMKRERMSFYMGRDSLMGWGAFFDKDWIQCLDHYIGRFGMDKVFHREADRIFTTLLPVHRLTMEAKVRDFPSAMAGHALSLQVEHEQTKQIALDRCNQILKKGRS